METPVRPTVTRKMLLGQPKYPAARTDAYMDHLEGEVAELRAKVDFLATPTLVSLNMEKNPKTGNMEADIRARHPLIPIIANALGGLLKDCGGPNFFTMELLSEEVGGMEITIQRVSGKSTAKVLGEWRERAEAAESKLAALEVGI